MQGASHIKSAVKLFETLHGKRSLKVRRFVNALLAGQKRDSQVIKQVYSEQTKENIAAIIQTYSLIVQKDFVNTSIPGVTQEEISDCNVLDMCVLPCVERKNKCVHQKTVQQVENGIVSINQKPSNITSIASGLPDYKILVIQNASKTYVFFPYGTTFNPKSIYMESKIDEDEGKNYSPLFQSCYSVFKKYVETSKKTCFYGHSMGAVILKYCLLRFYSEVGSTPNPKNVQIMATGPQTIAVWSLASWLEKGIRDKILEKWAHTLLEIMKKTEREVYEIMVEEFKDMLTIIVTRDGKSYDNMYQYYGYPTIMIGNVEYKYNQSHPYIEYDTKPSVTILNDSNEDNYFAEGIGIHDFEVYREIFKRWLSTKTLA